MKIDYQRVIKLRKHFSMTQVEFGEAIGMLQKSISRFETGLTKKIPNEYLIFMHKNGISIDWIMGWSDTMFMADKTELSANEIENLKNKMNEANTQKCKELENEVQELKSTIWKLKAEIYDMERRDKKFL